MNSVEFIAKAKSYLPTATLEEAGTFYKNLLTKNYDPTLIAELAKIDRWFLLVVVLNRKDAVHPWLYARCREVEQNPDGMLDLWARGHYKSTIITYAGTIQEIVKNPNITIGIFSHTRPIAKGFLKQIKREFEINDFLRELFPNVCYANPRQDSPQWGEEAGIIVRRKSNPKEATVEAWGLVDGQPISRHYDLRIYDDVVTRDSVNTPDQISKTTEALDLSQNLAGGQNREWYIGTRYHYADTYRDLIDRGTQTRIYPATKEGTPDGTPILLSEADWAKKRMSMGQYVLACQMLQNPIAGSEQVFDPEWIRRIEVRPRILNVYIMCDPAHSKKQSSDKTAIAVVGIDHAFNKYLLDGVCHRMNLKERWETLKKVRNRWLRQTGVQTVKVGYERYGKDSDIEHFQEMMKIETNYFPIQELAWPREGPGSKRDRVQRLQPDFENWRFFLAPSSESLTSSQKKAFELGDGALIVRPIRNKDENGRVYDLTQRMIDNEYNLFPAVHVDMLDAMSRIYDIKASPPQTIFGDDLEPEAIPSY
jgi:hypothetical protein